MCIHFNCLFLFLLVFSSPLQNIVQKQQVVEEEEEEEEEEEVVEEAPARPASPFAGLFGSKAAAPAKEAPVPPQAKPTPAPVSC
jgi:hypothetical protein